jgi:Protein of unknown function (DUF3592)
MNKPNPPLLPLFVVIIFGVIAPLFMGYVAYDIGRNSIYHRVLAEKLSSDGVPTTARVTARGPCKGSGRQPLDCWFSYEFEADQRTISRSEVRIRYTETRDYPIGRTFRVIYSAQTPQQSTHRTLAAHYDYAWSNFWAAIGCVVFILATFYIATRQLIGRFPTHALAVATAVLYSSWFAGLLAAH